jgi:protein-ribulosamine 3-kinase
MLISSIQSYLNHLLFKKLDRQISSIQFNSVGGGSINETYQVRINNNIKFFLKLNSATRYPGLFEKEKKGLEFLSKRKIIPVPSVIACEVIDNHQVLLLEWVEGGIRGEQFWKQFGEKLAILHRQTWTNENGQTLFGFSEDNYMGALPQLNDQLENWIEFFIHRRLQPQIKMAEEKQLLGPKQLSAFEKLFTKLPGIFNIEDSALLHGDLWAGNFMCNENSELVLIDPAVYFGHRSMDLAMTTLFGGFDKFFYESYNYHFPLPSNYHDQWEICNLYPLLIHLNLFGLGYLSQVKNTLQKFS